MSIPAVRYWFKWTPMLGLFGNAYWTVIAIIGLAPMLESNFKWELLIFGAVLTVLTWYGLARVAREWEEAERRAAEGIAAADSRRTAESGRADWRMERVMSVVQDEGRLTRDVVLAQTGSVKGAPLIDVRARARVLGDDDGFRQRRD